MNNFDIACFLKYFQFLFITHINVDICTTITK